RRTLLRAAPDDVEQGLGLAVALSSAGRGADALSTLDALRRLPPPAGTDPRIDLEESRAAAVSGDLPRALHASQRAAAGQARGARLLVAQARLAEADTQRRLGRQDLALRATEEAQQVFAAAGDTAGVARALGYRASALWYQGELL